MEAARERSPWRGLPPELGAVLRPELPAISDEIIAAVAREVPAYARPLEGSFGAGIRFGTVRALERFVELIEHPDSPEARDREVYVALGQGELRAGRSLDALLAAYRIGARVAWRRTAEVGVRAGLEPAVLYRLAEAMFAYIDGLSAESAEGYAAEQTVAAGERQRHRQSLARLLLQEPPADAASVGAAAGAAGWRLPRSLAALAVPDADGDRLAGRIGPEVLALTEDGLATCLVPDPDGPGRPARLGRALEDRRAALGPSVDPPLAWRSARRARLALDLGLDGLVLADSHLAELAIRADPELAQELAGRKLSAFEALRPAVRERLLQTLRAWLERQGRVEETARALHVHPQTVRYRVRQLRGLLGHELDDPRGRFELELALRLEQPD